MTNEYVNYLRTLASHDGEVGRKAQDELMKIADLDEVVDPTDGETLRDVLRHDKGHDDWHAAHGDPPCKDEADCARMRAKYDDDDADGVAKKKDDTDYGSIISDRKGEPVNAKLYAKVIADAKKKFDVYPSAVANGWVVQEYKRRGGKYVVSKREVSEDERASLAEAGNAMPDGSYPIANESDLKNAIQSYGRAKDKSGVKSHIKRRAKELGRTDLLPEKWAKKKAKKNASAKVIKELKRMKLTDPSRVEAIDRIIASLKKASDNSYTPTSAVQSNAKRALEWIADGKAGGGFTSVGRKRASDLARGASVSMETIKRMKAYFDRHQSDKDATGFNSGEDGFPSPGRVAWDAWGGDAAWSWATEIVEREKKKEKKVVKYSEDQEREANGRFGSGTTNDVHALDVDKLPDASRAIYNDAVKSITQYGLNSQPMSGRVDGVLKTHAYLIGLGHSPEVVTEVFNSLKSHSMGLDAQVIADARLNSWLADPKSPQGAALRDFSALEVNLASKIEDAQREKIANEYNNKERYTDRGDGVLRNDSDRDITWDNRQAAISAAQEKIGVYSRRGDFGDRTLVPWSKSAGGALGFTPDRRMKREDLQSQGWYPLAGVSAYTVGQQGESEVLMWNPSMLANAKK